MATEKIKVLYIAGTSRSGSTILGNILGQIDGFFHVGELFHIWQKGFVENWKCGCGSSFRECEVWKAVVDKAFGSIDQVNADEMLSLLKGFNKPRRIPLLLSPTSAFLKGRLDGYLSSIKKLYESLHCLTGNKVIVDSSKFPAYLWALGVIPTVDLYIVHLVRHPQGYAFSYMRQRPYPSGIHSEKYMANQHPAKSALVWLIENTGIELLCHHKQYIRVYYEDFMKQPQDTVINILKFVKKEGSELPFVSDRRVKLDPCHTISGNPVRFQTGIIELQPDIEWISKMSRQHRLTVTLLTWPLLLKYRYPSREGIYQAPSC